MKEKGKIAVSYCPFCNKVIKIPVNRFPARWKRCRHWVMGDNKRHKFEKMIMLKKSVAVKIKIGYYDY